MCDSPYWSADGVLEELGIFEPQDIDVEAIAQFCGATVIYQPLDGCAASILGRGQAAFITVDSKSPRPRQRFSVGHELGHWMYDRGSTILACTEHSMNSYGREARRETRANQYAADILLPGSMFVSRAEGCEMTFHSVRSLAETFCTSLTSTAIRLVELGSFPAMVVYVEKGRCRWVARGPGVPNTLKYAEIPGPQSVAHDLIQGGTKLDRPEDVGAENWVDDPDASSYMVREHSLRISKEAVLSLVWWKNERQLLDLEEEES